MSTNIDTVKTNLKLIFGLYTKKKELSNLAFSGALKDTVDNANQFKDFRASTSKFGFVKIGSNINVSQDGVISLPYDTSSIGTDISSLKSRVGTVESDFSGFKKDDYNPFKSSTNTSITNINNGLTTLNGLIDDLNTSVGNLNSKKADKVSLTQGTAGTSSDTSGSTLAVPYLIMNSQGLVTGYGTHTHTITGFSSSSHNHDSSYAPKSHNHDDRYYTEGETNNLLNTKASLAGCTFTGAVTFNSNVSCNGTLYGSVLKSSSDRNLKENIKEYDTDISSLKAYTYNFKQDPKKEIRVGLIAQDVQKVLPEAVSKDDNGNLSLDYNAIVAVLINKVNELEKEVKKLKGE